MIINKFIKKENNTLSLCFTSHLEQAWHYLKQGLVFNIRASGKVLYREYISLP